MTLTKSWDAPEDTEILLQKALKAFEAGQETEAERLCKDALKHNPNLARAENILGAIAHMRGNGDLAISHMQRAADLDPTDPNNGLNLAMLYLQKNNRPQAIAALDTALERHPLMPQLLERRLNMAFEDKDYISAERLLNAALAQMPGQPQMLGLLVQALDMQEKFLDALPHYRQLVVSPAATAQHQAGFGRALYHAGEFAEAIPAFKKAAEGGAGNAALYYHLGLCCDFTGNHADAAKYFHESLKLDPFYKAAEGAQTLLKLKMSNLREGLDKYSIRQAYGSGHERLFSFPQWNGQPVAGKKLLLWGEQGMGDIIMFAGFVPYLLEQGASLTFMVYPGLMALFARSFPGCAIHPLTVEPDPEIENQSFDFHVPMGNLLTLLKDYQPRSKPGYLVPDAARVAEFSKRHEALGGKKTVGISWFTEVTPSNRVRNIPLEQWKPILETPGCRFVSLQYGDAAADIAECAKRQGITIHVDPEVDNVLDKDAFAAQIASLDAVISIQNTTVHLAGALNVPTVILLSACSDFRWGVERDDNDWYASVKIMRQPHYGDWSPVVSRAAQWLSER